jgi:hypothetical protein
VRISRLAGVLIVVHSTGLFFDKRKSKGNCKEELGSFVACWRAAGKMSYRCAIPIFVFNNTLPVLQSVAAEHAFYKATVPCGEKMAWRESGLID